MLLGWASLVGCEEMNMEGDGEVDEEDGLT